MMMFYSEAFGSKPLSMGMILWPQAEIGPPGCGENAIASRVWKGDYE